MESKIDIMDARGYRFKRIIYIKSSRIRLRSNMGLPPREEIYQTLLLQSNIVAEQKSKMKGLKQCVNQLKNMPLIAHRTVKKRHPKSSELSALAENLLKVKLDGKESKISSISSHAGDNFDSFQNITIRKKRSPLVIDAKDLNAVKQLHNEMVTNLPKINTKPPFNYYKKEKDEYLARSMINNKKICDSAASKTISLKDVTQPTEKQKDIKESKSSNSMIKPVQTLTKGTLDTDPGTSPFKIHSPSSFISTSASDSQLPSFTNNTVRNFASDSSKFETSFFKPTPQADVAIPKRDSNEQANIKISNNKENSVPSFNSALKSPTYIQTNNEPTSEKTVPSASALLYKNSEKDISGSLPSSKGTAIQEGNKSPLFSLSNMVQGFGENSEQKTSISFGSPNSLLNTTNTFKLSIKSSDSPKPSSLFGSSVTPEISSEQVKTVQTPSKTDGGVAAATSIFSGFSVLSNKAQTDAKEGGGVMPTLSFTSSLSATPLSSKSNTNIFGGAQSTQSSLNLFSFNKPSVPPAAAVQEQTPKTDTAANADNGNNANNKETTNEKDASPEKFFPKSTSLFGGSGNQNTMLFGNKSLFGNPSQTETMFNFTVNTSAATAAAAAAAAATTVGEVDSSKQTLTSPAFTSPLSSAGEGFKIELGSNTSENSTTVANSSIGFSFTQTLANKSSPTTATSVTTSIETLKETITTSPASTVSVTPSPNTASTSPATSSPISFTTSFGLSASKPAAETPTVTAPAEESKVSSTSSESLSPVSVTDSVEPDTVQQVITSPPVSQPTASSSAFSFSNFSFGQPTVSTVPSSGSKMTLTFGQPTGSSIFGSSTTPASPIPSVFGETSPTPATTKTPFSFTLPETTTQSGSSFFTSKLSFGSTTPQQTAVTSSSFFGQTASSSPVTSASPNLFGQATTSPFGQLQQSPQPTGAFGAFSSKPTFGQPSGGLFGQTSSSSTFGSTPGSMFGGSSLFGSAGGAGGNENAAANTSGGLFQSPGSSNLFGGNRPLGAASPVGSFSQPTTHAISQTGFGAPAFQSKPAAGFGSAPSFGSSPSFGGAPTFGGSPTFGSPGKVFGSAPSPGFGAPSTQQSTTFENLASQNTMSFGNLAQQGQTQQSTGFVGGTMFGSAPPQNQPQNTTPGFPSSSFGGNSFSSWR